MSMPSDEYLRKLQDKLFNIEQEVGNLQADIGLYLRSARNSDDVDDLIKSLSDVQAVIARDWPTAHITPMQQGFEKGLADSGKMWFEKIERPFNKGTSSGGIIPMEGTTEEVRFNCGPHAVLIRPGSIDGPPPFKVVVWLNADKGNTSHNPAFLEIRSSREFKTREAAYEYGSHLCRRTNGRSAD